MDNNNERSGLYPLSIISLGVSIIGSVLFSASFKNIALIPLFVLVAIASVILPLVAKHYRLNSEMKGKFFEVSAIVIGGFNFYCIIFGLTKWPSIIGYLGWVFCAFVYRSQTKKQAMQEDVQSENDANVKYNERGEKLVFCTGENGNQAWVLETKASEWLEHQKIEVSSDVEEVANVPENDVQNATEEDDVVPSNEKPENEEKEETYIYAESANGMIVRIPESKYESWEKNQQKIRENGIDTTVFDEVREKLRGVDLNAMVASVAKETEESKVSNDKSESLAIPEDAPVVATIDNNFKLKMMEEKKNNDVRHVVPREKEVRFCYHCGYRVLKDSFFCEKCGTKVR